jgi:hypothetical protein
MIPNIAIVGMSVALVFASGVYSGYKVTVASYQEQDIQRQQEVNQALLERDKVIAEINRKYQEDLFKTEKEHEKAIKLLKHDYSVNSGKRLSIKTTCSNTGTSTSDDRPDVPDPRATQTIQLPEQVNDDLWRLAYDADEVVESYRALKHWLVLQGLYKDETKGSN